MRFFLILFFTFPLFSQWGGNTAPAWGGNIAPAWGGNPAVSAQDTCRPGCDIYVANANNAGAGSLRQAIADAVDGDTIGFVPEMFHSDSVIVLTSAISVSNKEIAILGCGFGEIVVSGDSATHLFDFSPGAKSMVIKGLTFKRGIGNAGVTSQAAIVISPSTGSVLLDSCIIDSCYNIGGTLAAIGSALHVVSGSGGAVMVKNTVIQNCYSSSSAVSDPGNMGAIAIGNNNGNLNFTLENCAVINNVAIGGTPRAGGMVIWANMTNTEINIINCTFSGNYNDNGNGHALHDRRTSSTGNVLRIYNSTFAGNGTGTAGRAIYLQGSAVDTLINNVIANNTGVSTTGPDILGTVAFMQTSCIGDQGTGLTITSDGGGNLLDTDPALQTLTFDANTWVYPIPDTSACYNAGTDLSSSKGVTTDQRGVSRPQSTEYDMGAFELE